MHYVNTTFDFWGNSLLEKGKYLVIESSYLNQSNENEVLQIYCSFSFLKDKKSNKLVVALEFLYFLTVLSLYSNAFC